MPRAGGGAAQVSGARQQAARQWRILAANRDTRRGTPMVADSRTLLRSRRAFVQGASALGLGLLAGCGRWPGLQTPAKIYRIGVLSESAPGPQDLAFRQGLHDLGYTEEQNYLIDYRWAEGQVDRLPELAAELVRIPADVIVVGGNPSIRAGTDATSTIPIVFTVAGDPVGRGFVQSLARPRGSVTGLSNLGRAVE